MIFNSLTYLLLLVTVVALYWVLPYRARLLLILGASLTFYGFWRVEFLPVLLLSTVVDWWVAQRMVGKPDRQRFYLLLVSLTVNLGLLFYFKYLIFFADNAIGLANLLGAEIDPIALYIILPLGSAFIPFRPSAIRWMSTGALSSRSATLCSMPVTSPSFRNWWPGRFCVRRRSSISSRTVSSSHGTTFS